eukprot:1961607-Alexandrium_andersonii.AAC.1
MPPCLQALALYSSRRIRRSPFALCCEARSPAHARARSAPRAKPERLNGPHAVTRMAARSYALAALAPEPSEAMFLSLIHISEPTRLALI